jgi:hypothetical protein
MTDYSYFETDELNDLLADMKQELWNINYDWHTYAPILRHKILVAEQELTRR